MIEKDKYFDLLSTKFQSSDEIVSEIINLKAILDLPKGTEHFVSDLHESTVPSNIFYVTVLEILRKKSKIYSTKL